MNVQLLTSVTLAQAYGFGTVAADQTLTILDANGGGLVVDGTAAGFTGTNSLTVKATDAAGNVSAGIQPVTGLEQWGAWTQTSYGVLFAQMARFIGAGPLFLW